MSQWGVYDPWTDTAQKTITVPTAGVQGDFSSTLPVSEFFLPMGMQDATVGHKESFAYSDLAASTGTVYGVQVVTGAIKDDAGTRLLKNLARSAGTDSLSAAVGLGSSYLYYPTIYETDPATSAAWTPATINAAEFGVEVD